MVRGSDGHGGGGREGEGKEEATARAIGSHRSFAAAGALGRQVRQTVGTTGGQR